MAWPASSHWRRVLVGGLAVALLGASAPPSGSAQTPAPAPGAGGELLLDRTVAIVGGAVVTQSEIDLAVALGLVTPGTNGAATGADAVVDRRLMLHEVARFSPPDPDPAAVEARLAAMRAQAGGAAAVAAALARSGFTAARLAAWVRDDLRITAYLDQRFASAGAPMEADVAGYLEAHASEFARAGVTPDEIPAAARARLVIERRRDLITDWMADLRRRTEVVEFRRPPGGG